MYLLEVSIAICVYSGQYFHLSWIWFDNVKVKYCFVHWCTWYEGTWTFKIIMMKSIQADIVPIHDLCDYIFNKSL